MEKLKKENLIEDTTDNTEKVGSFGVEISKSPEVDILNEKLRVLESAISHDTSINSTDLDNLESSINQTKIDIGGELMTLEDAEKIPDLKRNIMIWKNIEDGNLNAVYMLTRLSDRVAELLSQRHTDLRLDKVTTLSDQAAEYLSKHTMLLYLYGLTTLSDQAAKSLAKHKGGLVANEEIKSQIEKFKK